MVVQNDESVKVLVDTLAKIFRFSDRNDPVDIFLGTFLQKHKPANNWGIPATKSR